MLITGGAGFIGSRLAAALRHPGHRVIVADSLHPQVHPESRWPSSLPADVETHLVDVTDPGALDRLLEVGRPDIVVHLAAETGTGQSLTEASRHGLVNVVGTTQLCDAMTRIGHVPEHVVLTSSRAVYGEGNWRERGGGPFAASSRGAVQLASGRWDPVGPSDPEATVLPCPHVAGAVEPRPTSVYGATKLAQEHVLAAWTSAMGSRLSVLRLQNVYGAGQSLSNPYAGVLNVFALRALAGQEIDVYEDGQILRDFVHVDDVVEALTRAIHRPTAEPLIVDIGSGVPHSLLNVARLVAKIADGPEPVVSGRYRLGDVRAAWADVTPARRLLGYEPTVDPATGLSSLLDWIGGL